VPGDAEGGSRRGPCGPGPAHRELPQATKATTGGATSRHREGRALISKDACKSLCDGLLPCSLPPGALHEPWSEEELVPEVTRWHKVPMRLRSIANHSALRRPYRCMFAESLSRT
jgi:hypothetical protein